MGCSVALEILPANMKAGEKTALMKKAYSTLIICLEDCVLREVTKKTTAAGIWTKDTYVTYVVPSSYENFMDTLSCGSESLTMKDVLATLNSRELKKRNEGTKEENGSLKRDCPLKKSSRFVKKDKRDQYSDSSNDEGNPYFREALVVVGNDEKTKLVMNSDESYHMTHMRDFWYDFKVVDGGSVQLGLRRSLILLGTLEKESYTVKIQMGRIKMVKSCLVMMTGIKQKNRVYNLEVKVMTFGVQKHEVGFKQLGPGVETDVHKVHDEKRVWFEVELQGAQGDREAEVFQVSNDEATVAQRRLEDKKLKETTNMTAWCSFALAFLKTELHKNKEAPNGTNGRVDF
nr:hypothetical protein [Tanacetum cinerariifolium]